MDPARAGVLIAAYMLPFGLFQLALRPAGRPVRQAPRGHRSRWRSSRVATALCASAAGIARPDGVPGAHRDLRRRHDARLAGADRRRRADAGPAEGDRHLHGHRLPRAGDLHDHRRHDRRSLQLARGLPRRTRRWRSSSSSHCTSPRAAFSGQLKGDPHSQFLRPYGRLLAHGPSLRTYLLVFVEGALILGSFSYAGAYAAKALGLETLGIGLLMAVFGVGVIGGSRFSGRLAAALGRPRLVALGLGSAAAADLLLATLGSHLAAFAVAILLLGLGFMFAHSSLLTMATEFAESARGAAMSLIAFAFMVGGSGGTMLGGRIILGASYQTLYLGFGVALAGSVWWPWSRCRPAGPRPNTPGSVPACPRPTRPDGPTADPPGRDARRRPGSTPGVRGGTLSPMEPLPHELTLDRFVLEMGRRPVRDLTHERFVDLVERLAISDELLDGRTHFLDGDYARNLVLRTPVLRTAGPVLEARPAVHHPRPRRVAQRHPRPVGRADVARLSPRRRRRAGRGSGRTRLRGPRPAGRGARRRGSRRNPSAGEQVRRASRHRPRLRPAAAGADRLRHGVVRGGETLAPPQLRGRPHEAEPRRRRRIAARAPPRSVQALGQLSLAGQTCRAAPSGGCRRASMTRSIRQGVSHARPFPDRSRRVGAHAAPSGASRLSAEARPAPPQARSRASGRSMESVEQEDPLGVRETLADVGVKKVDLLLERLVHASDLPSPLLL